ncbi:MAG TPA: phage tail tape measure protein, partial [Cytophagales bacterium]|nr:phage tail tape measure protein [Cytophagales bacterium]
MAQTIKIRIEADPKGAVTGIKLVGNSLDDLTSKANNATKNTGLLSKAFGVLGSVFKVMTGVIKGFQFALQSIVNVMQVLGGILKITLIPALVAMKVAFEAVKKAGEILTNLISRALNIAITAFRVLLITTAAAIVALNTAITAAIVAAAKLDESVRNVITLLGTEGLRNLRSFGAAIRSTAAEFGKSSDDLGKALFDIVSAGRRGAQALDIMRQAAKAAVAGVATVSATVSAGLTVLDLFSGQVRDVADAFDFLFEVQRKGRTTLAQVAQDFPRALAAAAGVGIKLNEVGAALSTITRSIPNTAEAITGLTQLITAISRDFGAGADAARALGVDIGALAIHEKGLVGVLKDLARLSVSDQQRIVREVRGRRALIPLTKNLAGFMSDLADQTNRAGKVNDAFNVQMAGLAQTMRVLRSSFKSFGEALGEVFIDPSGKGGRVASIFKPLVELFKPGNLRSFFGAFIDEMQLLEFEIDKIVGRVASMFGRIFSGGGETGRSVAQIVVGFLDGVVKATERLEPVFKKILSALDDVFEKLLAFGEITIGRVSGAVGAIGNLGAGTSARAAALDVAGQPPLTAAEETGALIGDVVRSAMSMIIKPLEILMQPMNDFFKSEAGKDILDGLFKVLEGILLGIEKSFEILFRTLPLVVTLLRGLLFIFEKSTAGIFDPVTKEEAVRRFIKRRTSKSRLPMVGAAELDAKRLAEDLERIEARSFGVADIRKSFISGLRSARGFLPKIKEALTKILTDPKVTVKALTRDLPELVEEIVESAMKFAGIAVERGLKEVGTSKRTEFQKAADKARAERDLTAFDIAGGPSGTTTTISDNILEGFKLAITKIRGQIESVTKSTKSFTDALNPFLKLDRIKDSIKSLTGFINTLASHRTALIKASDGSKKFVTEIASADVLMKDATDQLKKLNQAMTNELINSIKRLFKEFETGLQRIFGALETLFGIKLPSGISGFFNKVRGVGNLVSGVRGVGGAIQGAG